MRPSTKWITSAATWVATPSGFLWCMGVLIAGGFAGVLMGFSDRWLLIYNLYLSIAATVQGNLILVAGRKSEQALQLKADEQIRANPEADKRLIGIEDREAELDRVTEAG